MFESSRKIVDLNESGQSSTSSLGGSPSSSQAGGGKVVHDARGNAIWQWGVATGVFARIKSAELLSMLDNPKLSLEGELPIAAGEWGGDPYNRR